MIPQQTALPGRQVNNILQNLRGEQFRHTRNVQGKPASSSALSSHAHNQPTLPYNLIYPPETSRPWVPGPSPPRSWRSPTTTQSGVGNNTTPAWRERALSLLFSPSSSSSDDTPPRLTLLCLQLIRATYPGTDLADIVPFIPSHLRRALVRHAAIHAPLSQIELDALRSGSTHIDTELVVVGPHNTLRASTFRRNGLDPTDDSDSDSGDSGAASNLDASWDTDTDTVHAKDSELLVLRSLAVLSSPLSAATILALPPTITHLALINIPHRIPLPRLPMICPLIVFLDLSYNTWLRACGHGEPLILEEVEWRKLQRLEVLGLRECSVTPKLSLELNKGRWGAVRIIQ